MPVFGLFKPGFTDRTTVDGVRSFLHERGVSIDFVSDEKRLPLEFLQELYQEHEGKDFYEGHMAYVSGGPCRVVVMSLSPQEYPETRDETQVLDRLLRSKTDRSIRSTFGKSIRENVMHISDSAEANERETQFAKKYHLL